MQNILDKVYQDSIKEKIAPLKVNASKFIIDLINKNNYKTYLEIGSGLGYSSLFIYATTAVNKITTIERDPIRFLKAKENLKDYQKIDLINIDCFDYEVNDKYDFILLDGPKTRLEELFLKYIKLLNKNGIMIIDNIYLKNLADLEIKTNNQARILLKLNEFND
jgi:predicted O-methyltransferase YrrM